ncbi:MAG: HAD-IA family hydrolase [Bacilli bacterium]
MKKALFFDLDGTLWNALTPLCESWNKAMEEHGLKYRFDLKSMTSYMGLTPAETVPLAFKDVDFKTGLDYFNICLEAEIGYLKDHPGFLYPHEEEVIRRISSIYPIYIISNSGKGYVENYLNSCHMGKYFRGHLCVGDTGLVKSDNIIYLKKKENIDRVIYIGDTKKDLDESRKAGVDFIHASYGFGKIDEKIPAISSLSDLEKEVETVFSL